MIYYFRLIVVTFVLNLSMHGIARGDLVINITQSGADVLFVASGELNMSEASYFATSGSGSGVVNPSGANIRMGVGSRDRYLVPLGPTTFGSGTGTLADINTGDVVGLFGASSGTMSEIYVPSGYVSGTSLSATSTYQSSSFASLGLTEGQYIYSWGAGANSDSLTVNIGSAAIPEPSSLLLFGFGVMALNSSRRRKTN